MAIRDRKTRLTTPILSVDPVRPDPVAVQEAVRRLRAGQLIALPTDTVYGLAASSGSSRGLEQLARVKRRQAGKPFPLQVGNLADARALVRAFPRAASVLARRFWPGSLTLVLPARPGLPESLSHDGFVGIRIADLVLPRAIAEALGVPLAVPSANRAGEPPPCSAASISAPVRRAAAVVFNGGETTGGVPSTVVRVSRGRIEILREGALAAGEIRKALDVKGFRKVGA